MQYALKIRSKLELLDQRQASGAQCERFVIFKLNHPCVFKLIKAYPVCSGLNLIQGGDLYSGQPEN